MRFTVAALAAFVVLMLSLDPSRAPAASDASIAQVSSVPPDAASDAVPFAVRFTGVPVTDEEPSAIVANETSAPEVRPDDIAAEPEVSNVDAFCHTLKEAAEASQIPVAFFARLIWQESRFRANEVSHAGAQGVAQFMPKTSAEVGLDDPFDPLKALPASARLLHKLRDDFGNLGLAAAAYNAGSGRIQKWLARQSDLPQETRDYVRIITGTKAEDWTEDADTLAIRADLPRGAPCEGVGGLSASEEFALVRALPAPGVRMIIRKAKAEALAARASAGRARRRLALMLGKHNRGAARTHAPEVKFAKGRAIRVASRERSSS